MTNIATGTFTINMSDPDMVVNGQVARFGLTKAWSGDITGTGTGVMLAGGDPATGHAGYVAIEVIEGTVHGRRGTCLLQQFGDLDDGNEVLHYQVVNGSGTGELAGLRGQLDLEIDDDGVHHYELAYTLPA